MNLVDLHCYRLAIGRVYRHMALDPEGAAQPPTVWRSASNYIVYQLETDTGLKGIGKISDFRDNIGQLDPSRLRQLLLEALKGIDLRHRRRAWEAVRQALPPMPAEFRQLLAASRARGLENPETVGADAAAALARVRRALPVPLIEHVGDFSDEFALALVKHRAVDVFNVIPVQTGSLHRAQRLLHLAAQAGIQAMLGSTVELGPGLAASLHLALAAAAVSVPSSLVSPGFLVDDVVEPQFKCRNGTLSVPQAPGLGIRLAAEKLQKYRLSSR